MFFVMGSKEKQKKNQKEKRKLKTLCQIPSKHYLTKKS